MSKTPEPPVTPHSVTVDNADMVGQPAYPAPHEYRIHETHWRAGRFADALLANPRADQLLRLGHLVPGELGHDLADACWHMAKAFNRHLDALKQAAIDAEQAQ